MADTLSKELLHTLRMKGSASGEALAGILEAALPATTEALSGLCTEGLARQGETPRGVIYSLTEEGVSIHAEALAAEHSPECITGLERTYESFLQLNGAIKALCTRWQGLAPDAEEARWEAIDQLVSAHDQSQPVLQEAASFAPRFQRYASRLVSSIENLEDGDERYFTGLLVDSFHNIWFECHEDFIQTLGRERAQEGSF